MCYLRPWVDALPLCQGIYWEAGLLLRTPFTEGCADGVNYQTLPLAAQLSCTLSTTTFSSVQFSSVQLIFKVQLTPNPPYIHSLKIAYLARPLKFLHGEVRLPELINHQTLTPGIYSNIQYIHHMSVRRGPHTHTHTHTPSRCVASFL